MNSDHVFRALTEIENAKGNQKKVVMLQYIDHDIFERVLRAAYDPFTTYGIARLPVFDTADEGEVFDASTWNLLRCLASRELSGNAAGVAVSKELSRLSAASAQLLWRIITKDLRAGFTANTVNQVKRIIPTFDCMLAHKFEDKRLEKCKLPVMVEEKLDGVRTLCFVDLPSETVKFFSRNGNEFTSFEHLKAPMFEKVMSRHVQLIADGVDGIEQLVFDGEVVSGSFLDTVRQVRKKDTEATDAEYHVFHGLTLRDFLSGSSTATIEEDRKWLDALFGELFSDGPIKLLPYTLAYTVDEIRELYRQVFDKGGEGVIVKNPAGRYVCTRNHAWMKIKGEQSVEARIVGAFEGTGKYEGMLGGVIVDVDGVEVRVGGGFSDQQRKEFWDAWQMDLEFEAQSRTFIDWNSLGRLKGRLIEVQYHEKTPDGSLRHPRFVRFRDDKDKARAA
jgi:DNA ligase-1